MKEAGNAVTASETAPPAEVVIDRQGNTTEEHMEEAHDVVTTPDVAPEEEIIIDEQSSNPTEEHTSLGAGLPASEQIEPAATTQPQASTGSVTSATCAASAAFAAPAVSAAFADSAASGALGRRAVHRQLSPDGAQMLLRPPNVDNKGPFSPPWQLISLAADVRLDVNRSGQGRGAEMTIVAPSEECLVRAEKYVRLVCSSQRQWCKVNLKADDDKDLTLLQCPEELWSWVLGKQEGNLHTIAEDNGVLIFLVGEWRKLGEPQQPALPSWLHSGRSVDVRASDDIREANWSTATVVEMLKSQTLRVKTAMNVVKTVDMGNIRPHFDEGTLVEVLADDDAETWVTASFSSRVEGSDRIKVILEGSMAETELDSAKVRPVKSDEEQAEPTFQLAIFGQKHGRCAAQLRLMSAVDWKRPGYYPGPMSLCMPPEEDWRYEKVELAPEEVSKCIGTKGDIRRQLCRASNCVIDCLGTVFYVCGPDENCTFGVNLLQIVRESKKSVIEGIPEGVEDYCETITIPDWIVTFVAGKGRKRFEQIEQKEGVMIFLFKPPQPLQEMASSAVRQDTQNNTVQAQLLDEPQEEPKTVHEQEEEADMQKKHADAELGENDDEQEQRSDGNGENTVVFVFSFSARARLCAHLRICRAVEQRLEGYCMEDVQPVEHDDTCVMTDIVQFTQDERAWLTGKTGRNQKAVEAASGCAMEYFGDFAYIVGTGVERMRCRTYLSWLRQQEGALSRSGRLVEISAEELRGRDDISVLEVTEEERASLLAGGRDTLDDIEAASGTFIFFRKVPTSELWAPGRRAAISAGGRRFLAELVVAPGDDGLLQFRLCDQGTNEQRLESSESIPLLICGHDEGVGGKCGRALAEQKIKDVLAAAKKAASVTAAPALRQADEAAEASLGDDGWHAWAAQSAGGNSKNGSGKWSVGGTGSAKRRNETGESESWEHWSGNDNRGNSRQREGDVWADWGPSAGAPGDYNTGSKAWDDDWSNWQERGADSGNVRKNTNWQENWTADSVSDGQDSWGRWQGSVTRNGGWGPAGRGGGSNRRR